MFINCVYNEPVIHSFVVSVVSFFKQNNFYAQNFQASYIQIMEIFENLEQLSQNLVNKYVTNNISQNESNQENEIIQSNSQYDINYVQQDIHKEKDKFYDVNLIIKNNKNLISTINNNQISNQNLIQEDKSKVIINEYDENENINKEDELDEENSIKNNNKKKRRNKRKKKKNNAECIDNLIDEKDFDELIFLEKLLKTDDTMNNKSKRKLIVLTEEEKKMFKIPGIE